MTVEDIAPVDTDNELRELALRRLSKKRDFHAHLLVYVLVNSCLAMIWVLAGADGTFWPAFFMAFWGIGLIMNAWDVYRRPEFGEAEIRREMSRLRGSN